MKFGVALPTNRGGLRDGGLRQIVSALEATACCSVWVNDHLAAFPAGAEHYPYSPTGDIDWDPYAPQYEALTACAYLAGITERLQIGTSVLVLPQRHPIEVGKCAATIAVLSGGRFVLGAGVGWSRREMRLLGWDPASRGARMDEQLDILRACWDPARPLPSPRHYEIPQDVILRPAPSPAETPAILVGGMSAAALRRVSRHGDGWLAVSGPDPSQLHAVGRTLARLRASTPRPLAAVLKVSLGTPDAALAAEVVDHVAHHGWDEISFEFGAWDLAHVCALLETCAAKGAAHVPE